MTEWLKALFVSIFGNNSALATFFISMVPIIELRGAIPFGMSKELWGANALEFWQALLLSVAGGIVVCVVLTFAFMPIFGWLSKTKALKKFAEFIENKLKSQSKDLDEKTKAEKDAKRIAKIKWWFVFVFVAIPLPLTGVWTGTCLALFVGLNKKQTISAASLGNLCAGIIMTIVSLVFKDNTMVVLYGFLILVLLFLMFAVVRHFVKKAKSKKANLNNKVVEKNESEEATTEEIKQKP